MSRLISAVRALFTLVVLSSFAAQPADWNQFRGPNSSGIAEGKPPVDIDRKERLKWSTPLTAGHSSPSVTGSRIYFTAFDAALKRLEVIAVEAKTGDVAWRRDVPVTEVEKVHELGSPATATPVSNGKRVYAYFGSVGLLAYDMQGKLLWKFPLPLPKMSFGSGTSPVIVGDRVVLNRDERESPYLLAVDASDGKEVWRQSYSRPSNFGTYATPVMWNGSILVHRQGELVGFDPATGKQIWKAEAGAGASTPAVQSDRIYLTAWSPFGEADHTPPLPSFDELLKHDNGGDAKLTKEEFPADVYLFKRPNINVTGSAVPLRNFILNADTSKDGSIDRSEWDEVRGQLLKNRENVRNHGLIAIDKEGKILWKEPRSVPEIASPIFYNGRVYMVTNGGIVTCVNAEDGKLVYRERLGASGPYFASPVAANGHLYFASSEGVVTVVKDNADKLQVVARHDFAEPIYGTPAISGDRLYIRTTQRLYAFGQ